MIPAEEHKDWGVSYGMMVRREFFKSALNRLSLAFIVILFAVAVLAPFIANDKPYIIRIDGQLYFPVFRALTANDYSIFLSVMIAAVLLLLLRRDSRKVDPFLRPEVIWKQTVICSVIFVVGIIAIQLFVPRRLNATDYKSMVASGRADEAVFAPIPYGFARTDIKSRNQGPSKEHWFGTDDVGSDVLCRIIHGSRTSLSVGFVAVGISSVIGIFAGAIMGYFGGKIDFIGMRFVEIMMAVPTFFLIITIVAFFPRSLLNIMIIIGITGWTGNARFIRAEFLKLRNRDFVQAAISLSLPLRSILFRHMLPNGIAPVLVNVTFGVASAIFVEAALSFLGFGVAPPTPSWGQMLSLSVSASGRFFWWMTLFPGLAIFFTVLAYNLIGEGLRDALDPKLKAR